ncbi:hypothetical protein KR018_001302 [Drosophila ironensis]|nr:hypothetical protein KR018_001302 [Drosophila ironensis]
MVDPNRKINRLVDRDVGFLEECELEFSGRFTEDDPDFMAHCSKPLPDPPIVENWASGGGGGGGAGRGGGRDGRDGGYHPYRSHNRFNGNNQRGGWQRRERGGGYHNNHDRGFRGKSSTPQSTSYTVNYAQSPDNRRHNRYDHRDRRDRHDSREEGSGGGGGGGGGGGSGGGYKRSFNRQDSNHDQPPMKVRRDYGNFVPASKD